MAYVRLTVNECEIDHYVPTPLCDSLMRDYESHENDLIVVGGIVYKSAEVDLKRMAECDSCGRLNELEAVCPICK